ncbi:MAG: murein biosynthesis integral membrane protein MurJ [Acidimicrobiales bacterium]
MIRTRAARPATAVGAGGHVDLARSTAAMTLWTLVSRTTGFVRVLVVAAVLGTTFLGNTYQSANTVPNLLFELFAAGLLQAVLIPSLVDILGRGDKAEAEHVAGSVLGVVAGGLAVLAGVGMLLAPWIMRALVAGVASEEVRAAQIRLGTFLLWFFLPQVVLYAAGMVATGVLNARDRFALPVFAPVVNNVVVTASYGLFWLLRDGAEPSLDLTLSQKLVLGGGTTLGVLAFCAVPVLAVARSGFSLRPRLDIRHPEVRRLLRRGVWAALYLVSTQVLLAAVLVLANAVEGAVVAYQVAYTVFLVPHAVLALPVLTALFPTLARATTSGDGTGYARSLSGGVLAIAYLAAPASAALIALAGPLAALTLFGEGARSAATVAGAIAAFAPGLLGYGAFLFLARAHYATGDTRTPALVNLGVAASGVVAMAAAAAVSSPEGRVAALAGVHSLAYLAGSGVLLVQVRRHLPGRARLALARPLVTTLAAATLSTGAMWLVRAPLDLPGRAGAAVQVAAAGGVGVGVYLASQAGLGGLRPAGVAAVLRGDGG